NRSRPFTATWTVDTTPPAVTIGAGPGDPSGSSAADFSLSADDPDAVFACSLDGADYTACTTPVDYGGLAEGAHVFAARATDAAGNVGAAASLRWTIDLTAPTATVVSGPPDPSGSSAAELVFSADDPVAVFSCALDGAGYAPCTSPVDYAGLVEGAHVFAVRATDAAGNTGAPLAVAWTIDLSGPVVTIGAGPGDPSGSSAADFSLSADDPDAVFACSLDGADYTACTTPV